MKNDRPGPDPVIVAALRRLGDQHEPDSTAIWARVDPARTGVEAPGRLVGRRVRAPRTTQTGPTTAAVRRPRFAGAVAVSLAAASVLGVLGLTQAVTRQPQSGVPVATTLPTGDGEVLTTPGPDGKPAPVLGDPASTSPAVPPSGQNRPQTPPAGGGGVQNTPPAPKTVPPTGSGAVSGLVAPSVAPLANQQEFQLTTDVYEDWVAVGARNDRNQVRAKRPAGGLALTVDAPAEAAVTASPLLVSWTGGYTEQNRIRSSTWLQGSPGGAWTITVERVDVPRRLVVLAGGAAGGFQIDSSTPDGRAGRWTATNPTGSGPFALELEVPAGSGPMTVTLTGSEDGLSVAAVTLQRI